jgi:CheY-like chemotaxis protein
MARVLVVDDDPDILKIVERVLRMQEHDVYTAHDAMKAMDLLNSSTFDLMLTDANMPRFSGFELARTIKNNKKFQKMAIVMLTGLREKKDIEKAIRAGIDDYIVKPIDPAVLLQKVAQIFLKKPPIEKVEYLLPENATYGISQLTIPARITHVNETGLTLRACTEMPEGMVLIIIAGLFKKMDMSKPPTMKVLSSRKIVEFDYEIKIVFTGAGEVFHKKVRDWILSQKPAVKGVA